MVIRTRAEQIANQWIDETGVLDAWVDRRRGARITLHRLVEPLDNEGYAIVVGDHEGRARRVVVMLKDGDSLASLNEGEEDRHLRRRVTRLGKRIAVATIATLVAAILAGCGTSSDGSDAPVATDPASTGEPSEPTTTTPTVPGEESGTPPAASRYLPAKDCEPFVPAALPSGAAPGEGRELTPAGPTEATWEWGEGQDSAAAAWGFEILANTDPSSWFPDDYPEHQTTYKDGERRLVMPVGDPPLGEIQIRFDIDDCPYTVWIGPGFTIEEAVEYAGRL